MITLRPTIPEFRYFRTVFRESPVLLVSSRMLNPSRRCQRLITLNNATSITPDYPARSRTTGSVSYVGQISMQTPTQTGSVLGANQHREEIVRRIGRSPDRASAVILTMVDAPSLDELHALRDQFQKQDMFSYDPYATINEPGKRMTQSVPVYHHRFDPYA